MKIAISGAHFTGKTALAEELSHSLNHYESFEEPYYLLEEEGYEFCELPSLEDYEEQLSYSIDITLNSQKDTIFDRCPLDFLAYISVHEDYSFFDQDIWSQKVSDAMEQIDLVVLVPIEDPDIVACPENENLELRQRVSLEIQKLVYEFEIASNVKVLEVLGTIENRASQILAFINSK